MRCKRRVLLGRCPPFFRAFLVLVSLALPPLPARAQVARAAVAVDGMSCPFCAFGVEKRLKKVKGVASATVDLKKGTAALVAKEGRSIAVAEIPGAVEDAGFTVGAVEIVARGRVGMDEGGRFSLKAGPGGRRFLLLDLLDGDEKRLRAWSQGGTLVRVSGEAGALDSAAPTLNVKEMAAAPDENDSAP